MKPPKEVWVCRHTFDVLCAPQYCACLCNGLCDMDEKPCDATRYVPAGPDSAVDAIAEFDKVVRCLAITLPEAVWEDVNAKWQRIRQQHQ